MKKHQQKCNENHWVVHCGGCKDGHDSFWKTVVTSPQWQAWEQEAYKQGFDYSEVSECGWISQKHFQAFLQFTFENQ